MVEFDDRGLSIIGNNVQVLRFYDDARTLRATIYLDGDNRLNIGDLKINTSTGGTGGGAVDLSAIAFVTIAESPLLSNERILTQGDGLTFTDGGGGAAYTIGVNGTVVRTTRQIISGAGLTGGGTLASDRTLAVGAGDGISVGADSVAVDGTVVRTTRTLTAGTLLGGGGTLASDLTFNVELHHIVRLGSGTTTEYAASDAGLTAALAAAGSGEVVVLPACAITGTGWTVPAGVMLTGQLEASALAGALTVNGAADRLRVVGGIAGGTSAIVANCHVVPTAGGTGILLSGTRALAIHCLVDGVYGASYGIRLTGSLSRAEFCQVEAWSYTTPGVVATGMYVGSGASAYMCSVGGENVGIELADGSVDHCLAISAAGVGLKQSGTASYAYHTTCSGPGYDVQNVSGTLGLYGCYYSDSSGTLTYLTGDRASMGDIDEAIALAILGW